VADATVAIAAHAAFGADCAYGTITGHRRAIARAGGSISVARVAVGGRTAIAAIAARTGHVAAVAAGTGACAARSRRIAGRAVATSAGGGARAATCSG